VSHSWRRYCCPVTTSQLCQYHRINHARRPPSIILTHYARIYNVSIDSRPLKRTPPSLQHSHLYAWRWPLIPRSWKLFQQSPIEISRHANYVLTDVPVLTDVLIYSTARVFNKLTYLRTEGRTIAKHNASSYLLLAAEALNLRQSFWLHYRPMPTVNVDVVIVNKMSGLHRL